MSNTQRTDTPDQTDEERDEALPTDPPPDDPPDDDDDNGDDRDDSDPGPWVTIASFLEPMRAHIARLKLEAEDIDCYLDNENLVATDWLYSNATGGVKLKVPASQAPRALQALQSHALADPASAGALSPLQTCPKCGSPDIYRTRLSFRLFMLSILVLGFPLPILRRSSRCAACGHEWPPNKRGFPVIPPRPPDGQDAPG